MKRLKGLIAVALLLVGTGAWHAVQAVRGFRGGPVAWAAFDLALAVVVIACGVGCGMRQPRARVVTIVVMALNIVSLVVLWIQHPDFRAAGDSLVDGVAHGVALGVSVLSVAYLMLPKVAAACVRRT